MCAWSKISIKLRCNSLVLFYLSFVPVVENSALQPTHSGYFQLAAIQTGTVGRNPPTELHWVLKPIPHPVTLPRVNLSSIRICMWAREKESCLLVLCGVLAMISITKWKTIVPIRSRKPGKKVLTNQVRISPQNKTYPTHIRCKGETVAIRV